MHLALWQNRWREYMRLRNFSERSIDSYVCELGIFFRFLEAIGIGKLAEVTRETLEEYRAHLYEREMRGRRISANTQAGYLSHLRGFFGFLMRDGFLPHDPTATLDLPRRIRTLPRTILSESETERVLEAVAGKEPIDVRNRAIVELLYCTAIRNQELRDLTLDDVSIEGAEVRVVRGKGGKSRTLPLGEEAKHWLVEYLARSRPHLVRQAGQRRFFLSLNGRPIGRATLAKLVRVIAHQAGLDKVVTPHVLRHCCATHMLRRGAGLRQLQELMGHESLQSIQRYTRLDVSDLRQVLERCHPREKKV